GVWTAPIKIGSTLTLGASYTNNASEFGGGVAGTVPFEVRPMNSDPVFGTNIPFSSSPVAPSYKFDHYGWVDFLIEKPVAVRLERRARCIGQDWLDVTDAWEFDYTIANDPSSV